MQTGQTTNTATGRLGTPSVDRNNQKISSRPSLPRHKGSSSYKEGLCVSTRESKSFFLPQSSLKALNSLDNKNNKMNSSSSGAAIGLKLNLGKVKNDVGFHEEFMSHLDEFSLSWRLAAAKEKQF